MWLLVMCGALAPARAQVFDLDYDRQPVVALRGMWRFHTGDDLRWADPKFDDAQWALLRGDRDWAGQGHKDLSGMAWYRFKVVVPEGKLPLSLYVPMLMTSYEVYADGVKIGGFGKMPPDARADHNLPQVIALPAGQAARTVTFAVRVWHAPLWANYYGGGPHAAALVGATTLLQERAAQDVSGQAWSIVDEIVLAILEGLAGLAALAFFFLQPSDREYLWFGLMLLFSAAVRCFSNWGLSHAMGVLLRDDISGTLTTLMSLAAMAFYRRFLHGKRGWLFWFAASGVVAGGLTGLADGTLLTVQQSQELEAVFMLPFSVWVLALLFKTAKAGVADARLLLFPVLLQQAATLTGDAVWLSYLTGAQHKYAQQDVMLASWPFYFTLSDLTALLFLFVMLAILIGRFTRTRREEERFAAELDAARSVQHVLIPDEIPPVAGYAITGIYHPASEVGGDFFQVIPLEELGCVAGDQTGGMLVVVGDVSGKGLQAAMNVSLIVGSLRTLVDHTQRPAEILAGLNRRLFGRSNGGFTTCLVMLIDAAGALTVATAGHLAPYRNGMELELEDGLPLGLSLDAEYGESRFRLEPGDRLTMISDGVLEARNAHGELFGFERTRALSTQDATYIANAAQAFGQEDDITVLTLKKLVGARA